MDTRKPCPMSHWQSYLSLLGRIGIGTLFLLAALGKLFQPEGTQSYMTTKGLTFMVPVLMYAAAFIEILGALFLVMGYKTRWTAFFLSLFLIPVTLIMHNFWQLASPEKDAVTMLFVKNLAIIGGLLYVSAWGAGKYSLDHLCCTRQNKEAK